MMFLQYLRNGLTNRATWGWGVLFMIFWLVMGAYVFDTNTPVSYEGINVAAYYGIFGLISFSSIATSFSFVIMYSSRSLPYAFRYSLLRPGRYVADFLSSFLVIAVVFGAILLASTYIIFTLKFNHSFPPQNIPAALAASAFTGVFLASFDLVLAILVMNYLGMKSMQFVAFIPMILTYALVFPALFLNNLPSIIYYASPFNAFFALLFSSYSGIWVVGAPIQAGIPIMNEYLCILSIAVWITVFVVSAMFLVRRIKPRALEEGRPI